MTPKFLLRHPDARSPLEDFLEGSNLQRLIPEDGAGITDPQRVKKVLFCSGKVYYDLVKERAARGLDHRIAIARVEQVGRPCVDIKMPPVVFKNLMRHEWVINIRQMISTSAQTSSSNKSIKLNYETA